MKKETVVAAVLTVALSPISLLINTKTAVSVLIVGVVVTIAVQMFWKEHPPHPDMDSNKDSFNPVNTQIANPTFTASPTINVFPPLAPPVEKPEPRRSVAPTPNPNLVFLGSPNLTVNIEEDNRTGLANVYPDERGDFYALVAKFRNEAAKNRVVGMLYRVNSHISYRDVNQNEIGDGIAGAYWLEEVSESADFHPGGATRSLVLLTKPLAEDRLLVPWVRHTGGSWMGTGLEGQATEISEMPTSIRVQLLNGSEVVEEIVLATRLIEGRFEASARPPVQP